MAAQKDEDYIDLFDSDSEDEFILSSNVARARTSHSEGLSDEDSSFDHDDIPPLSQRLRTRNRRRRKCSTIKSNKKAKVAYREEDDDNDLKIPAVVVDIDMGESSEIEDFPTVPASVSISPTTNPSNASIESSKSKPKASAASISKYVKMLQNSVKKRTFPLSQIPEYEVISTGRTIKPLKAWKGHWAALREFLQNTVDHLNLMSSVTGRRQDCLRMKVDTNDDILASISFTCGEEDICKMTISSNEVVIDQLYTYPIASRALDTGVPDSTKSSSKSQAGGFGDGFKTAAVALIANSKKNDFKSLKWCFYCTKEKVKIEWDFLGLTKNKVAAFEKCQVLQVNIDKKAANPTEINDILKTYPVKKKSGCSGHDYIMRQTIQVKGIGTSFLEQAVPRFVVFWDLNESSLISMTGRATRSCGGDCVGPTALQPSLFNGIIGNSLKPKSGIYVKGIYVRPTKIKDTIMCFFGDRLDVSGRDRNEIDEDELIDAVIQLIGRCNNINYLNELLSPLRGTSQSNENLTRGGNRNRNGKISWLLQSPRFFNRVIEVQKDFILHNVFKIPRGALFVSKKTTDSKDPFISWSAKFLKKHGAPLVPISKGANRFLFEEVDRYELTEKCVAILKQHEKDKSRLNGKTNETQAIFRKFFSFMCMGRLKVFFSPEINVAFVHNASIFIPEAPLSRDLVVKVLNVCHSQIEGSNEAYSCLLQSIFEIIEPRSRAFTGTDATTVINRSKEVLKESRNFLVQSIHQRSDQPTSAPPKTIISLDSDDEEVSDFGNNTSSSSSNKEQLVPTTIAHLEEQIKKVSRRVTSKKRSYGSDEAAGTIIPQSMFENDNAGDDTCLRPSSSLTSVNVDAALGGGSIWFDKETASEVDNGKFNPNYQTRILSLRKALKEAKDIVHRSIPSLGTLLNRVMAGYDAKNDTYEGFCNGNQIIINLFSYLPKLASRTLVHDLIVVVTHEIAHFLEPEAGHGPTWRDTHMKMVTEVMRHFENQR